MHLLNLSDLNASDIQAIWSMADGDDRQPAMAGTTVAWSFEGNGIRTRSTFIQAFRELGLPCTELPNLLKTGERVQDLAGYLDPLFGLYVIRDSDHDRLTAFAAASERPVVNAMSGRGHPCEVLTDAYFIDRSVKPLRNATVCLWGPTTNVLRSWHELASVLGVQVIQVCDERHHEAGQPVAFTTNAPAHADVVITDAWPHGMDGTPNGLTAEHLRAMGSPVLLPTPPFTIGGEVLLDPCTYAGFAGYGQKRLLLPVQKAILRFVAGGQSSDHR
jgi:ornithine carbamoyltransferase